MGRYKAVLSSSHFFENRPVSVLTSCHENLIGSHVTYIADENRSGYKIPNFFKLTQFSDRPVYAYTIKVHLHIRFSQPGY